MSDRLLSGDIGRLVRLPFRLLAMLVFFLLAAVVISYLFSIASAANEADQTVLSLEIRDEIKAGTLVDVNRAIAQAEEVSADQLIIRLDTPGGLLNTTRSIVESIQASSVPITVYVDQPSGWAFSAGTIILLAADTAMVHPNASIGAAQPFTPEGGNEVQDEKTVEATISWVRGLATESGRDADVAERFVRENLTLRGNEALAAAVIDGTPETFEQLLVDLELANAEVIELSPSLTAQVLNIISSPYLVSLFLTLGSLALLLAVRSGEFEFTAIIGVILLLIGLWGIGVIEFTVLGIGLIVLGVVLIVIEMFDQPGFGLFGVGGLLSVVAGVFTLSEEPFYRQDILSTAGIITVLTLLVSVVTLGLISRSLVRSIKSQPVSGKEGLVGKDVIALTKLDPRGRVRLRAGENWQAELKDRRRVMKKDDEGCIIDVVGNTLIIEHKQDKET